MKRKKLLGAHSSILSSLNSPIGRPARRRTVSGERPSSFSLRGSVLKTRNRLLIASLTANSTLYGFAALLLLVLLVGDVLHPIDDLAIYLLLNGNVGHPRGRSRTMPVLLAGGEPDYVTGPDLFDWPVLSAEPSHNRRSR